METEIVESRTSIKVIKNTKGYNYEVKCVKEANESDESLFSRIVVLEEKCRVKYGTAIIDKNDPSD